MIIIYNIADGYNLKTDYENIYFYIRRYLYEFIECVSRMYGAAFT